MLNKVLFTRALTDQLPVSEADISLPRLHDGTLRLVLLLIACPVAALILSPLAYLFLWALRGTEILGVFTDSSSLHWFGVVLRDPIWQQSLAYSFVFASLVSAVGALSLSIHFYSIRFMPNWYARVAFGLVALVILLPSVVYGVALATVGGRMGVPDSVLLLIGQLVVVMPVQYFVLESAQGEISSELLLAGVTLGAHHRDNFRAVYWPLCKRSLWNAIVVGFFLTFDELVIASFVIHGSWATIPKMLWDRIDSMNDPVPAVISLLLFAAYLLQAVFRLLVARLSNVLERGRR